jgi:hypothetical protein
MDVLVGRVYKHFKGNYYLVVGTALNTETEEVMVIYKALYEDGQVFARPISSFTEKVERNNQTYRFELQEIESQTNHQ